MFSWEINEIMSHKDYRLNPDDYLKICSSSTQITHVHYDAYSNRYHIYTEDGYHWEFEVKYD